ncbi:MarR family winged helix-turn-helix transcriptional regulator [Bradyrhizobium sp. 2TAF36]|uniref:MarR family winged helix-turn-helix transcriptional regulator n=1 Tax=Bradyrhizobium sp. 2TAF36 TaxID=3233016 RepID=UPI003F932C75
MTAIYDEALAPSGLKVTMFRVVRRLSETGEPSITELAAIVDLDRSSLGAQFESPRAGRICRSRRGEDERSKVVKLTPKGRAALARAKPLWIAVQRRMKAKLSTEADALLRTTSVVKAELEQGKSA